MINVGVAVVYFVGMAMGALLAFGEAEWWVWAAQPLMWIVGAAITARLAGRKAVS